ncbi:MAG: cpaC [Sphingomonadales bacterium]|nr:cpaC [Sphingomonadales bacterium]
MKHIHKILLMTAAAALTVPTVAWAQDDDAQETAALVRPIAVRSVRTMRFDRQIGKIEIDREGVIAVRAPTPRSIAITGTRPGKAILSVYAQGGALLTSGQVSVIDQVSRGSAQDGSGTSPGGMIDANSEQMVAVDVQFAAVSTTTLKALGFNFSKLSGDIQGAVISPSSLTSFAFNPAGLALSATAPLQNAFNLFLAGPNRGIGAVLSALSSTGLSQMLAEPTLIVRSGEQAHFLAGGEIPIPVPQNAGGTGGGTISIEYKEFGVRLSVAPFVLSNGRIVMKIAPEVSELDYANGVQLQGYNVPGIRRRSAETTVQLASGQSFVIAGLNYTNSTVNKEKMPFLGDLPVIGAFFKRQQNQKERQELIIVATPRLVGPMEAGTMPTLPGTAQEAPDPSIGDMILGTDGIEQRSRPFGVVRR